jgi:hypothetical protein
VVPHTHRGKAQDDTSSQKTNSSKVKIKLKISTAKPVIPQTEGRRMLSPQGSTSTGLSTGSLVIRDKPSKLFGPEQKGKGVICFCPVKKKLFTTENKTPKIAMGLDKEEKIRTISVR